MRQRSAVVWRFPVHIVVCLRPDSILLAGPRTCCPTRVVQLVRLVGQLVRELVRGLANFLCQSRHAEIETTSWLTFESASLVWQPASEVEFTNNLTFPYQTLLFWYLLIKNS